MNQTEATPVPQSTTDYGKRTFQLCHFLHQIFFTPKFYFTNFLLFRTICYSNFSHQNFYYTNFLLFRTIFYTNFLLHQFLCFSGPFVTSIFLHQNFFTPNIFYTKFFYTTFFYNKILLHEFLAFQTHFLHQFFPQKIFSPYEAFHYFWIITICWSDFFRNLFNCFLNRCSNYET